MSLVAWKPPYLLQVMVDHEPENPREECDLFGHMVCWHSRYNLGDRHPFERPGDFLKELVQRTVPGDAILDYVRAGKSDMVRLVGEEAKDGSIRGLRMERYDGYIKKWQEAECFPEGLEGQGQEVVDCLLDEMPTTDLLALAKMKNVVLPLYLYDHSGLALSVSSFVGHAQHAEWDSGQVGWVYATEKEICETYGNVSAETMGQAEKSLQSGVEDYNYYLSGQCYGFQLYEDGAETENSWGFLGSLPDVLKEIVGYVLPGEYQDMAGMFQEVPDVKISYLAYEDILGEIR